ncbi:NAD(P)/FAD-dependent oxidoreductase [Aestuariivirga litoralis]|uniref:NAD(P)/FAD-dependent oxidoreductase n=1 Tax=Aestuariivirga litoralis TaxID=2650924 RepID=UPI0018C73A70|nr:FAD-binding oxidoreductase [Aestuariivirga litoralis]MBG1232825.1 FAD-binding oxidoreductase [Aestuariivirga litoralis]
MNEFDFIVIGAGIAGASVAAHLSEKASVAVLEMEERAGYHTTGRSASSYEPNYGPEPIQILTRLAGAFFFNPPKEFADGALYHRRGSLFVEGPGQQAATETYLKTAKGITELNSIEIVKLHPVMKPSYAKRGFYDAVTGDLDVDLLHRGYLKLFKQRGGQVMLNAGVRELSYSDGKWTAATSAGNFSAPVVINAAGAWGDEVAKLAGVAPIGITPKRRSIAVVPIQGYEDFMRWPFVCDLGETWYAKPQSGKMLVSSADQTPVEPHDAYADDEAIATGIANFMDATTIEVTRVEHSWGGLRTFSKDKVPVAGFDVKAPGFFWLVGQGGYGIQSSPALSRLAAALASRAALPDDIAASEFKLSTILPDRFSK